MPKLTIDGKEVEVPAGTNLIEAARKVGVEIPHYCYHPGLSVAGQCRLCMVDIEKVPRPQIACNTQAADGMVVNTQSDRVRELRRSVMEFHLINHPLDCPVCDQAGECWLQIYYMRHGLYEPRMVDNKNHKAKAVPIGPHVMLDAERCILCSRCVRFCHEITGTGEMGIFNRGDHGEIGVFPGRDLTNKYSGNVVDICPVGALTDRHFRFQVRVWYLDGAKSICPGCARGCNVDVHVSRRRPHQNHGRRIARLKPRLNPEVNRWWMCDEGRYGFASVDADTRVRAAFRRDGDKVLEVSSAEAIAGVAGALARYNAEQVAIIASPLMSNEDLFALRRLAEGRGIRQIAFRVPPVAPGDEDRFLIRADKTPNTRGAELIGLDGDTAAILDGVRARRIKCLWVFGHDLLRSGLPEGPTLDAVLAAETLVWTGSNASAISERAHWGLPSAAWVEREGTYTNFEGRVQRFRTAVEPLGEALAEWDILGRVLGALGTEPPARRAEQWFRELTRAVPAFAGMTYQTVGDLGQPVVGAEARS